MSQIMTQEELEQLGDDYNRRLQAEGRVTLENMAKLGPVHTDPLLRSHELFLVTAREGSDGPVQVGLIDWESDTDAHFWEWADESRVAAYLDELEAESPMGFPGEEIAAMLRSSLLPHTVRRRCSGA